MATEVTMPQMGADMTEGTLVRWIKQVGDPVARGEIIAEIETDKATVELEAFDAGVMRTHVVEEGEVVPVGQVIALLGADGEDVGTAERKPPAETPVRRQIEVEPAAAPAATAVPAVSQVSPAPPPQAQSTDDGRLRISPVARRIASESGLDVRGLAGSGPDGRILRRDVEAALKTAPAAAPAPAAPPAPVRAPVSAPVSTAAGATEPMSKMRQAIARRMLLSKQNQPHYYLTLDVDMTDAMEFRRQMNSAANEQQRVTVNDLIVKACAIALDRHTKFNSEYTESGLKQHPQSNICIGIALDEGLIAPALIDVGSKSLGRIAIESKDLVERAKSGHLSQQEYTDGTFTITNLGSYGVETLIGIINPPQAAILGVGTVMPKPVVVDGEIVVRQVMKVALSADHRVSDGAEGARFIKEIQGLLENPASLAL